MTRRVRELFDRLPANRLHVGRLHVSVMQALVELAECDPEALVLMRGGTFAR